jgi:hypothetical protein
MVWKRNVQFAKKNTPHLMLNQSIAAILAPKKLESQSKKF